MERSFGSKYGKWIALLAVVLALALWFALSGGVENYRAKYEGYELSPQIGDIGAAIPTRCICARTRALRTLPRMWIFRCLPRNRTA